MKLTVPLEVVLTLALGISALTAQTNPHAQAVFSASSPLARIYLSHLPANPDWAKPLPSEIEGYTADSEGRLTPIPGGPWPGKAWATTGNWLFAENDTMQYAVSYKVDSAGALHEAAKYDLANRAPDGCEKWETFGFFTLDHTGATLYATGVGPDGNGCSNIGTIQSYKINKESGKLTYLGSADYDSLDDAPLVFTFTGNNLIALGGTCGISNTCDARLASLLRQGNGLLVKGATTVLQPIGTPAGQKYFAVQTKADPYGNLAAWLDPTLEAGNQVLAAYTVHPDGTVTTTNTFDQMPVTGRTAPPSLGSGLFEMSMSPSGKLLAVLEGGYGLRIYRFNGAKPITPYITLLPSNDDVVSFAWDNASHLYVQSTEALYVFTVTPTSNSQAPGSPYPTPQPGGILVRAISAQQ